MAGASGGGGYPAIAAGADGALWFPEPAASRIGRITTTGQASDFPLPGATGFQLAGVTAGPDRAIWFADGPQIGRIATGAAQAPTIAYTPPAVTATAGLALRITPTTTNAAGARFAISPALEAIPRVVVASGRELGHDDDQRRGRPEWRVPERRGSRAARRDRRGRQVGAVQRHQLLRLRQRSRRAYAGVTMEIWMEAAGPRAARELIDHGGAGVLCIGYGQSAPWFSGTLEEAAHYPTALSASRIAAHYTPDAPAEGQRHRHDINRVGPSL